MFKKKFLVLTRLTVHFIWSPVANVMYQMRVKREYNFKTLPRNLLNVSVIKHFCFCYEDNTDDPVLLSQYLHTISSAVL